LERDLKDRYHEAMPRMLGALLDALAGAMRELPGVEVERPPRMADFAAFGVAVERSLQWPAGSFLISYRQNIESLSSVVVDADPFASAIRRLVTESGRWSGIVSELATTLGARVDERVLRDRSWPRSSIAFSNRLRRAASALRSMGIQVEFHPRKNKERRISLELLETPSVTYVTSSPPRGDKSDEGDDPFMQGHVSSQQAQHTPKARRPATRSSSGRWVIRLGRSRT
jgi:hypothetical protein